MTLALTGDDKWLLMNGLHDLGDFRLTRIGIYENIAKLCINGANIHVKCDFDGMDQKNGLWVFFSLLLLLFSMNTPGNLNGNLLCS